jgi:hypothetical protein
MGTPNKRSKKNSDEEKENFYDTENCKKKR